MHLQQSALFKLHSSIIMTLILPSTALIVRIDKCTVIWRYASFKTGDRQSMRGCTMHLSQSFGKITQDFCVHIIFISILHAYRRQKGGGIEKNNSFFCSAAWKEYQGLNLCVRVQSMCMNV